MSHAGDIQNSRETYIKGINSNFGEIDPGSPTKIVLKKVTVKSPTQVKYQFDIACQAPDLVAWAKQKSSATGLKLNEPKTIPIPAPAPASAWANG